MDPKNKHHWTPEPFPKPRTIPEGWETSALMASSRENTGEVQDEVMEWQPESFPEPRTYPGGWNFTALK